jgi:hypothetical protein
MGLTIAVNPVPDTVGVHLYNEINARRLDITPDKKPRNQFNSACDATVSFAWLTVVQSLQDVVPGPPIHHGSARAEAISRTVRTNEVAFLTMSISLGIPRS